LPLTNDSHYDGPTAEADEWISLWRTNGRILTNDSHYDGPTAEADEWISSWRTNRQFWRMIVMAAAMIGSTEWTDEWCSTSTVPGKPYENTKPRILYRNKDVLIFEDLYWKFEL